MKSLLAAVFVCLFAPLTVAQTPSGAVTIVRPDGESKLFALAALAALPRESVAATDHDKPAVFTGSDVREVLRAAGIEPPDRVRGASMRRAILVQGEDGYAVVFAYAELDPSLGDRRVYLVDRIDDKPLSAADGPWRLVVPRDARGGRWVRQVTRISVVELR